MLHDRLSRQFLKAASRIRRGTLIVSTPEGVVHGFGGHEPGPDARLIVHDWCMIPAVASRGGAGLREACRRGWCGTPDPEGLMALALLNADLLNRDVGDHRLRRLALRVLDVLNRTTRAGAAPRRPCPAPWLVPTGPGRHHDP